MARWHTASCKSPQVVFGGSSTPRCGTCGASASKYLAGLREQASDPLPPVPLDEPLGQLNLSWPPSVLWTGSADDAACASNLEGQAQLEKPQEQRGASNANGSTPQEESSTDSSVIYGKILGIDQFRLICLEPPAKGVPPGVVHLTLETYQDDRRPEYETVSYIWGGEDGNSALRCPIYVGDYWDILLQTQNCFSMLQYLVPQRGIRMVWVDAICINQTSLAERADQVKKMGHIYSQCSHVFLWLGDDVVDPWSGTHPKRRRFHELFSNKAAGSRYKIRELLKRRYFHRVWVIQELVLGPRVVIPIGDAVFWADGRASSNLRHTETESNAWGWDDIEAPWLRYIGQGAVPSESFVQFMALARRNQASDPRDRIFGLFGLSPTSEDTLRPDYTLSFQHVFIGFVAYTLLSRGDLSLLHRAAATAAPEWMPSWLPDWRQNDAWEYIFDMRDQGDLGWETAEKNFEPLLDQWKSLNYSYSRITRLVPGFAPPHMNQEEEPAGVIPPDIWDEKLLETPLEMPQTTLSEEESREPEVERNTGRLSIDLRRITSIHHLPEPIGPDVYEIKSRGGWFQLYRFFCLMSGYPLDKIVRRGDEIWALEHSPDSATFLILRKVAGPRSFRLVATCWHLGLSTHVSEVPGGIVWTEELQVHLQDDLRRLSLEGSDEIIPLEEPEVLFPGSQGLLFRDMVTFPLRCAEEDQFAAGAFPKMWEDVYLGLISPEFKPRIANGECFLTIGAEKHEKVAQLTLQRDQATNLMPWEEVMPGKQHEATSHSNPSSTGSETVVLKRSLNSIEHDLKQFFRTHEDLEKYLRKCLRLLYAFDRNDGPALLMARIFKGSASDIEGKWPMPRRRKDMCNTIGLAFNLEGGIHRISIV